MAGERAAYRPLVSRYASGSSDPVAIARGLREAGASELYLADLDAITRRVAPNWELIDALDDLGLRLWVDAGVRDNSAAVVDQIDAGVAVVVVGLETVGGPGAVGRIIDRVGAEQVILSLDLRDGVPIIAPHADWRGDPRDEANLVAQAHEAGVQRVIRLDLARVGTGQGIDHFPPVDFAAGVEWWAGGGVRDRGDLQRLAALGYAGALVGSAVHDGVIELGGEAESVSGHRTS